VLLIRTPGVPDLLTYDDANRTGCNDRCKKDNCFFKNLDFSYFARSLFFG